MDSEVTTAPRAGLQRLLPGRRSAIGLGSAAVVVVAAHLALNSGAATGYLRRRILEKLEPRLGECTLGEETSVSWTGEVRVGPLEIAGPPGPASAVAIQLVEVRAKLAALLRGAVEPAAVTLVGLRVDTDRHGQRLRELIRRLRSEKPRTSTGSSRSSARALPELRLDDARIAIESDTPGEPAVLVGPISGRVSVVDPGGGEGQSIHAVLDLPSDGRVELSARLPATTPGTAQGSLDVEANRIPLAALAGPFLGRALEIKGGRANGKLHVDIQPDLSKAAATLQVQADDLTVSSERLATEPVGPITASYIGKLAWDREVAKVDLTESRVQLGTLGFEVPFEAEVDLGSEITFDADARLGPVNLQTVIASLPGQLRPGPAAPHLDGPLRAEIHASGPLRHLDDWAVELKLDTSAFKAIAREAAFPLREAFSYKPENIDGSQRVVWVGDRNPDFIPIAELPPIVAAAVTTSEDASFYSHNGFDLDEIRDSLANAAQGARLRGGSTLTQQLAKNLYLNKERTLARKVREALITLQLEAALPKSRILEIYLNIIEWGPEVHGIGQAARYYFGIDARNLDAKQAVFLASIIPNPVKFGPYFRHRGLTDNWQKHVSMEFDRLQERGFLTAEQCRQAMREPLAFREGAPTSRGARR